MTAVSVPDMAIALVLSFCLGLFIFFVYKKTYAGVMFSLDKLSLNNLIQDATMMKDYLAWTEATPPAETKAETASECPEE